MLEKVLLLYAALGIIPGEVITQVLVEVAPVTVSPFVKSVAPLLAIVIYVELSLPTILPVTPELLPVTVSPNVKEPLKVPAVYLSITSETDVMTFTDLLGVGYNAAAPKTAQFLIVALA